MPEVQANESSYERRDASVRLVVWFAAGLVLAALLMHLGIAGLYRVLENKYPSPEAPSLSPCIHGTLRHRHGYRRIRKSISTKFSLRKTNNFTAMAGSIVRPASFTSRLNVRSN